MTDKFKDHFSSQATDYARFRPNYPAELFAWLAESILYRLNQAPERCLLTFLETLAITPEPAQPALADLTFEPQDDPREPVLVPSNTPVASDVQTDDGPIVFETERELGLIPFKLVSVRAGGPGGFSEIPLDRPPFEPFGPEPGPENALYFGFEPVTTDLEFPAVISVLVDPNPVAGPASDERSAAPSTARLVWEYPTPGGGDRWTQLNLVEDRSRAFTTRGYVSVQGPTKSTPRSGVARTDRKLHWLRVRVDSGRYQPGHAPLLSALRRERRSMSTRCAPTSRQSAKRSSTISIRSWT